MRKFFWPLLAAVIWMAASASAAPLSSNLTTWNRVTGSGGAGGALIAGTLSGASVDANAATIESELNAAVGGAGTAFQTAFSGLTTDASMNGTFIYQAFDRTSGNAGDIVTFIYDYTLGAGDTFVAFAYDNGAPTILAADSNNSSLNDQPTPNTFTFTSSSNLLVGFGIFSSNQFTNATVSAVAQMPELNPASAALPLTLAFLAFAFVSDRRRREADVTA